MDGPIEAFRGGAFYKSGEWCQNRLYGGDSKKRGGWGRRREGKRPGHPGNGPLAPGSLVEKVHAVLLTGGALWPRRGQWYHGVLGAQAHRV